MSKTPKFRRYLDKQDLLYSKMEKKFFSSLFGKKLINGHYWKMCEPSCGPMVICGYCGNNCCSGGTRTISINGHTCGCKEAYKIQDDVFIEFTKYFKRRKVWRNRFK